MFLKNIKKLTLKMRSLLASPQDQVMERREDNIFYDITSGHTDYQIFTYDFGTGRKRFLITSFDRFYFRDRWTRCRN